LSLFLTSLSAAGAAEAVRAVEPLERGVRAASVGAGAAVEQLREPDASDEAWARIDLLLHQMRQLTLGGADSAAATTTAGAISAYSEHSNSDKGA
jgi:hypothetical protein